MIVIKEDSKHILKSVIKKYLKNIKWQTNKIYETADDKLYLFSFSLKIILYT